MSTAEKKLFKKAKYECSSYHKRNPLAWGLTPASPRDDANLCEDAGVATICEAWRIFRRGIKRALVSTGVMPDGFPSKFYIVDEKNVKQGDAVRVFVAKHGGTRVSKYGEQYAVYHGYPVQNKDSFADKVRKAW